MDRAAAVADRVAAEDVEWVAAGLWVPAVNVSARHAAKWSGISRVHPAIR